MLFEDPPNLKLVNAKAHEQFEFKIHENRWRNSKKGFSNFPTTMF